MQHSTAQEFYAAALDVLQSAAVPYLVGGAYAMRFYTGVERDTKDFDLMLCPGDIESAISAFRQAGFHADIAFPHWLAKAHQGEYFIDMVFRAGNGLCDVDESWFTRAQQADLFGRVVQISAPEELIWQKAYIMERERFDGADVLHVLLRSGAELDWDRLVERFGPDWRVLLSHLVLFGFVYPGERTLIPAGVLEELTARLAKEHEAAGERDLCRGPLLSRAQYLTDVERWSYHDIRQKDPRVRMSQSDIERWTNAIDRDQRPR